MEFPESRKDKIVHVELKLSLDRPPLAWKKDIMKIKRRLILLLWMHSIQNRSVNGTGT